MRAPPCTRAPTAAYGLRGGSDAATQPNSPEQLDPGVPPAMRRHGARQQLAAAPQHPRRSKHARRRRVPRRARLQQAGASAAARGAARAAAACSARAPRARCAPPPAYGDARATRFGRGARRRGVRTFRRKGHIGRQRHRPTYGKSNRCRPGHRRRVAIERRGACPTGSGPPGARNDASTTCATRWQAYLARRRGEQPVCVHSQVAARGVRHARARGGLHERGGAAAARRPAPGRYRASRRTQRAYRRRRTRQVLRRRGASPARTLVLSREADAHRAHAQA